MRRIIKKHQPINAPHIVLEIRIMKLHRAFVFLGRKRPHHHDSSLRRQHGIEGMGFDFKQIFRHVQSSNRQNGRQPVFAPNRQTRQAFKQHYHALPFSVTMPTSIVLEIRIMKLHRAFVFLGRKRPHHHDSSLRRQHGIEGMGFDFKQIFRHVQSSNRQNGRQPVFAPNRQTRQAFKQHYHALPFSVTMPTSNGYCKHIYVSTHRTTHKAPPYVPS